MRDGLWVKSELAHDDHKTGINGFSGSQQARKFQRFLQEIERFHVEIVRRFIEGREQALGK
ncbi:MAG: hypothetical protein Q7T44_01270 [Parvibaculum sp.]|nr:hypothetical protein [Parvibaculum sp.]